MRTYWLADRTTGELNLVDCDTVERLLGVELGYVGWCIGINGVFENGRWLLYHTGSCSQLNALETENDNFEN